MTLNRVVLLLKFVMLQVFLDKLGLKQADVLDRSW